MIALYIRVPRFEVISLLNKKEALNKSKSITHISPYPVGTRGGV